MARAFTIARALMINHDKIMIGALDTLDDLIYGKFVGHEDAEGSGYGRIDPSTLTFNTGFTDIDGNEIFTGDFVILKKAVLQNADGEWILDTSEFCDQRYLIFYDEDEGALCASGDFIFPFDRKRAARCRIVGNIYDKFLQSEESS